MPRPARTYTLSAAILAANLGTGILCLADAGQGRAYRLHAERPGASLNSVVRRASIPDGSAIVGAGGVIDPPTPKLILVRIDGAIEQRAGYHDPCDGWSDGHDAIADRLCSAFQEGDILLVIDSPGGAAAGLQQAVERALAAKVAHGRRVTVFADEMIGSAAMWWACALGDELFVPPAGQTGSIGARGQHTSIKGALDKEGILVTYFADPPEKVCFAPERLPDEETMRRGTRDVEIAASAFRAAVCNSPLGVRHGLTPEYLIGLGADMLTGQAAVDAGLADGVENFETVTAYALSLAESEEGSEARGQTTGAMGATKEHAMGLRASNGAPPGARAEADEKKNEEEKAGHEPTGECKTCGAANEDNAKFCDQCGKSMAAKPLEEEDDDKDPPSSKDPDSSKREGAAAHPPPPERMSATAPRRMSATASTASILGATADTPLAIKTAAIEMRAERDWLKSTLSGITGKDDTAEMIGVALNIPSKIAAGKRAAADLAKVKTAADAAERWQLADRLVKVQPHMRSKVFADLHDDAGNRITDPASKRSVRIRSRYAGMDLGTFRGLVSDFEGDAPKQRRDPFEPSKDAAREASEAAANANGVGATAGVPRLVNGEPMQADIDRAKKHPTVIKNAGGDPKRLDVFARTWVKTAAEQNIPIGGAA